LFFQRFQLIFESGYLLFGAQFLLPFLFYLLFGAQFLLPFLFYLLLQTYFSLFSKFRLFSGKFNFFQRLLGIPRSWAIVTRPNPYYEGN